MSIKETALLVLKKSQFDGRNKLTLTEFHNCLRKEGIVYPWLRKEALLYLEAIGKIEIDGNLITLIVNNEKIQENSSNRSS